MMKSPLVPGISIIAPAHNEASTVRESVRGLLSLRYPSMEVIVVNDPEAPSSVFAAGEALEFLQGKPRNCIGI